MIRASLFFFKKVEKWRFPYLFKEKKKFRTIFLQLFHSTIIFHIFYFTLYARIMINLFIVGESDLIRVGVMQLFEEK